MEEQPTQRPQQPTYEEIYRRYYRQVRAYACGVFGPDEADDIAQETFIRVLQQAAKLDHPDRLGGWLRVVAHRIGIDEHRRRSRSVPVELDRLDAVADPLPDAPTTEAVRRDAARRLDRAMGQLRDRDRMLLLTLDVEGVPAARFAALTGVSETTVRQQHFRARNALAREYRRLGGFDPRVLSWWPPAAAARSSLRRLQDVWCEVAPWCVHAADRAAVTVAIAGSLVLSPPHIAAAGQQAPVPNSHSVAATSKIVGLGVKHGIIANPKPRPAVRDLPHPGAGLLSPRRVLKAARSVLAQIKSGLIPATASLPVTYPTKEAADEVLRGTHVHRSKPGGHLGGPDRRPRLPVMELDRGKDRRPHRARGKDHGARQGQPRPGLPGPGH